MRAFKLFWGVSGPLSLLILIGLTSFWIVFLVASGLGSACDQSSSIIRKGSASLATPVFQGNLPKLRNSLNLLRTPFVDSITFIGASGIDQDVFGKVIDGRPPDWRFFSCVTNIEYMGLRVGTVQSSIDVLSFAVKRLREEVASVLFFWILALLVIVVSNYRALKALGSVSQSLQDFAQTDSPDNLRDVLSRAVELVPRNAGTKIILDSLAQILDTLAEVAELKIRTARAEDKAQLARHVGHDIRSPLSALRILMEKSKNLTSAEQELLRSCYRRVDEVAANLLSSAQTSDGSVYVELVSCVAEIIREKQLNYGQVEWVFQSNAKSLKALASKSELQRIISNILNNSLEAHASKINIEINVVLGVIELSVNDNGIGMPQEILDQINRGISTTTKGLNHGLGLTHARKAIMKCGGSIELRRSLLNGIMVIVRLQMAGGVSEIEYDDSPTFRSKVAHRLPN